MSLGVRVLSPGDVARRLLRLPAACTVYLRDRAAGTVLPVATLRNCRSEICLVLPNSTDTGPAIHTDPVTLSVWQIESFHEAGGHRVGIRGARVIKILLAIFQSSVLFLLKIESFK